MIYRYDIIITARIIHSLLQDCFGWWYVNLAVNKCFLGCWQGWLCFTACFPIHRLASYVGVGLILLSGATFGTCVVCPRNSYPVGLVRRVCM